MAEGLLGLHMEKADIQNAKNVVKYILLVYLRQLVEVPLVVEEVLVAGFPVVEEVLAVAEAVEASRNEKFNYSKLRLLISK